MIHSFEQYHGVALREIIVCAPGPLHIAPNDDMGRVNSYCLNKRVAVHIKHSAKRLPPWQFTFNDETVEEIERLEAQDLILWLVLVCGHDGLVALSAPEFRQINPAERGTTCFVRVDRDRRTMYRVFGTAGRLASAKARGVMPIFADAFEKGGTS